MGKLQENFDRAFRVLGIRARRVGVIMGRGREHFGRHYLLLIVALFVGLLFFPVVGVQAQQPDATGQTVQQAVKTSGTVAGFFVQGGLEILQGAMQDAGNLVTAPAGSFLRQHLVDPFTGAISSTVVDPVNRAANWLQQWSQNSGVVGSVVSAAISGVRTAVGTIGNAVGSIFGDSESAAFARSVFFATTLGPAGPVIQYMLDPSYQKGVNYSTATGYYALKEVATQLLNPLPTSVRNTLSGVLASIGLQPPDPATDMFLRAYEVANQIPLLAAPVGAVESTTGSLFSATSNVLGGVIGAFASVGGKVVYTIWDIAVFPMVDRILRATHLYALLGPIAILIFLTVFNQSEYSTTSLLPSPTTVVGAGSIALILAGLTILMLVSGVITRTLFIYPTLYNETRDRPGLDVQSLQQGNYQPEITISRHFGWYPDPLGTGADIFYPATDFSGDAFDQPNQSIVSTITTGQVTFLGYENPLDPASGAGMSVYLQTAGVAPFAAHQYADTSRAKTSGVLEVHYGNLDPYFFQGSVSNCVWWGGAVPAVQFDLVPQTANQALSGHLFNDPVVREPSGQADTATSPVGGGNFMMQTDVQGKYWVKIRQIPAGWKLCPGTSDQQLLTVDPSQLDQTNSVSFQIRPVWDPPPTATPAATTGDRGANNLANVTSPSGTPVPAVAQIGNGYDVPPHAASDVTSTLDQGVQPVLAAISQDAEAQNPVPIPWQITASNGVFIPVPHLTQIGTGPAANSNCGPASAAMVLSAFGFNTSVQQVRNTLIQINSYYADPNSGTAMDDHVKAVSLLSNKQVTGQLYYGAGGQNQALANLRAELDSGHVAIILVRYLSMPWIQDWQRRPDLVNTMHYVVINGYRVRGNGIWFYYQDPALLSQNWQPGHFQQDDGQLMEMSTTQLINAWGSAVPAWNATFYAPISDRTIVPPQPISPTPPSAVTSPNYQRLGPRLKLGQVLPQGQPFAYVGPSLDLTQPTHLRLEGLWVWPSNGPQPSASDLAPILVDPMLSYPTQAVLPKVIEPKRPLVNLEQFFPLTLLGDQALPLPPSTLPDNPSQTGYGFNAQYWWDPGGFGGGKLWQGLTGYPQPFAPEQIAIMESFYTNPVSDPSTLPGQPLPNVGGVMRWANLINAAAQRYGMPPVVIGAIIQIESSGNPNALSPMNYDASTGQPIGQAQGLMQIMPFWFQSAGIPSSMWLDPATNVNLGSRILLGYYQRYGSWTGAAGGYFGIGTDVNGQTTGGYIAKFLAACSALSAQGLSGSCS